MITDLPTKMFYEDKATLAYNLGLTFDPSAQQSTEQPASNSQQAGYLQTLKTMPMPMVVISVLVCLIAFAPIYLPSHIFCRIPYSGSMTSRCVSPIATLPNIAAVTETQIKILDDYSIALNSHSVQLVDLRSAMRDISTQIKHSGLTPKSKEEFGMSLNSLIKATMNAAESMESLESRTSVTLGYFIHYNRMMLADLQALDPKNRREDIKVAMDNLESTYLQVMSNMEKDMRKLEIQAREVSKYYQEMDMHLGKAYDTYVEENELQKADKIRLSTAWYIFGKDHVRTELFESNLNLLQKFEEDRGEKQRQIDHMSRSMRRYIKDIGALREKTRDTMLEKKEIDAHIENINQAIDQLEAKYNNKVAGYLK